MMNNPANVCSQCGTYCREQDHIMRAPCSVEAAVSRIAVLCHRTHSAISRLEVDLNIGDAYGDDACNFLPKPAPGFRRLRDFLDAFSDALWRTRSQSPGHRESGRHAPSG